MAEDSKFWDRIADRYSKDPISDVAAYEKKLAMTRQYLRPDMEVLEVGCGTGGTALQHAPYVKHILATDISSNMIDIARRKAGDVENVTFKVTGIGALSAADESFDAVLAMSILHLVDDLAEVLEKLFRLIKPGGVFVSSTVCIGDQPRIVRLILPIGKALGRIPLVRVFDAGSLVSSLNSVGFEIDHQWQPAKGDAVFIVAKKPE